MATPKENVCYYFYLLLGSDNSSNIQSMKITAHICMHQILKIFAHFSSVKEKKILLRSSETQKTVTADNVKTMKSATDKNQFKFPHKIRIFI